MFNKIQKLYDIYFNSFQFNLIENNLEIIVPANISEEYKRSAQKFIKDLNDSNEMGKPIVTEVVPLTEFYVAENFHKHVAYVCHEIHRIIVDNHVPWRLG